MNEETLPNGTDEEPTDLELRSDLLLCITAVLTCCFSFYRIAVFIEQFFTCYFQGAWIFYISMLTSTEYTKFKFKFKFKALFQAKLILC